MSESVDPASVALTPQIKPVSAAGRLDDSGPPR
jgi:hypothetical protein